MPIFGFPIGMMCLASATILDVMSESAALHVLAIGSIGGMTFAMMTRAPLGHTGRPLVVRKQIAWAYAMIAAATLLRGFFLDQLIGSYYQIAFAAGGLWIASFTIFTVIYMPILIGPSLKAQNDN